MVTFFLYGQFHSQMEKLTVTPPTELDPTFLDTTTPFGLYCDETFHLVRH